MFFDRLSRWYDSVSQAKEFNDKVEKQTVKGIIAKAELVCPDCVRVRMLDGRECVYTNCCQLHFTRGRLVEIISENNRLIQISVLD